MKKEFHSYRIFLGWMTRGKAVLVLAKTYSLVIDQLDNDEIKRIGVVWGELMNEHDMAVQFQVGYVRDINPNHPKAKAAVTYHVRQAKLAKAMVD